MLKTTIQSIVDVCTRRPWPVIVATLILTLLSGIYAARNFAINTDINTLISPDLPWRQRELALEKAFPERAELILVVVDAPTPELVQAASRALAERLKGQTALIRAVRESAGSEFFRRNGLLFLPPKEVGRTTGGLAAAEPFVAALARDPSLRGLSEALSLGLAGAQMGQGSLSDMTRPLTMAADTVEGALARRPAPFSWQVLLNGRPAAPGELRRFIEVWPVLDFNALEPGKAATDAIRRAAADLQLAQEFGARLRLTGPVPIADEEFATLKDGALVNGIATLIIVLAILWLALRSPKIIVAVSLNLLAGLAITAALGLMMVGALNPISVAFAVLFIGLGVDFGIQFSVRYRTERYAHDDLRAALRQGAGQVGAPLTLAAVATAAGFLSFLPTDYRGVSELGQIAGAGMLIAFISSITVLPALLTVLNPPGERAPLGYATLAPVDRFLRRRRMAIVAATVAVAVAGLPLLMYLRFDFNPLNLRSPNVESVATFLELRNDPQIGASSITVMATSMESARTIAERLERLPEVASTRTLASFVPGDQPRKLEMIARARAALGDALSTTPAAPPSDAGTVSSLTQTAAALENAASDAADGPGPQAARRLAAAMIQLARAEPAVRERAQAAFVTPLRIALADLRDLLQAQPVTLAGLPEDLVRAWTTADGRTRVEVLPKGDPNDNEVLRQFARAVLAVEPTAIGGPISILESGNTVVRAFIEAGLLALVVITILLWIVLRRLGDVALTLVPLLLAGVVTLEVCVLIGLQLNFANIIALPLLLGIGVAFMIYYTMAWRSGQTDLLQSPLTRAVIWSGLTTATAFGSLWLSNHPGTSSMGKLLALSLVATLCAAVLFQPALMGTPRSDTKA
ncbi:MAG: MMPL family transporter [Rhizobiales bacterium]|nr:MMPL family transporter [Hyphomicrobiales bacterium]